MFELTRKQILSLKEFLTKMFQVEDYDEWYEGQIRSTEKVRQILEEAEFESRTLITKDNFSEFVNS